MKSVDNTIGRLCHTDAFGCKLLYLLESLSCQFCKTDKHFAPKERHGLWFAVFLYKTFRRIGKLAHTFSNIRESTGELVPIFRINSLRSVVKLTLKAACLLT